MKAAIESSALGLQTEVQANGIRLIDTPLFTTTIANAPSLRLTGVAGGAVPIRFVQDASFTPEQMQKAIIDAINQAQRDGRTTLQSKLRGGSTLFVENASTISAGVSSFFLRGIQDNADNFLKSNRINNETQFTILMPGVLLDFGDAPDPVTTTPGRYPTSLAFDGARHVSNATALRLGPTISSELDGSPTPRADADVGDDGVAFQFQGATKAMFNRNVDTSVTVTLTQPGIVDGWIDFNADGDWTDAGENVLAGVVFTESTLSQTFQIRVPANAPVPTVSTNSFARFRASTAGNTLPTGLALDGEVEDYLVRLVPGVPPVGSSDSYTMNEDQNGGYVTTDPRGLVTPGFSADNGVLANDVSADGRTLLARVLTPPQNVVANSFVFNPDGTFTYIPTPNYFGQDTFVYLSYVNIDLAENEILESLVPTTVTFTIRPVNDVPTASNFSQIIDEDVPLTLTTKQVIALSTALPGPANESNQMLSLSLPSGATTQGGTVSIVNGAILYTPQQDFSGEDTFTFTLTDNGLTGTNSDPLSITRTVTITVRDKNDAPIVTPKSFTIAEDGSDVRSTNFYINNDTAGPTPELLPPNAQTITFTSVEPRSQFGGTVSLANGQITYRPAPDFNGTDRIYYTITDNGTSQGLADPQSSRGTVTVTVDSRLDDPRVLAQFGTLNMAEDAPARVLSFADYFFDPDVIPNGEVLTYRIVSNSNPGLVEPTLAGGNVTIQPKPDQNGTAVIVFEARDNTDRFITNTLTVIVSEVIDNPRLVSPLPNLNVNEDATIPPITLSPQYFFDPDIINGDTLTFSVTTSNEGLVSAAIANGQLRLTLVPNASGIATITVRAVDAAGNAVEDSFDVNIEAVNDAPRAVNDLFYQTRQTVDLRTTDARGTLTPTTQNDNGVLANDSDIEGNTFTARLRTAPTFGTVTINPDGTFIYSPRNAVQDAVDSFEYEAVDSLGAVSLPGRVNITITAPPPARH
jgi:VCBS repeat-containing protein